MSTSSPSVGFVDTNCELNDGRGGIWYVVFVCSPIPLSCEVREWESRNSYYCNSNFTHMVKIVQVLLFCILICFHGFSTTAKYLSTNN